VLFRSHTAAPGLSRVLGWRQWRRQRTVLGLLGVADGAATQVGPFATVGAVWHVIRVHMLECWLFRLKKPQVGLELGRLLHLACLNQKQLVLASR